MMPGSAMTVEISVMPPIVWSAPRIGDSASTLSTPFCRVMTRVSGVTIGLICAAAFSVSQSLTANSTMSTGATVAGIVGRGHFRQMQVAKRAFDLQPVAVQRVEMRAAGKERDVVPGRSQARAVIGADRACRP